MNWSKGWNEMVPLPYSEDEKEDVSGIKSVQLIIKPEDDAVYWIDAKQIGDLAVHEPIPDVQGMWRRITHVPTLAMFDKALPDDGWVSPTDDQLLTWIAEVQKGCLLEWAILRKLTSDNYMPKTDRVLKAKDKILEYSRATRIEK